MICNGLIEIASMPEAFAVHASFFWTFPLVKRPPTSTCFISYLGGSWLKVVAECTPLLTQVSLLGVAHNITSCGSFPREDGGAYEESDLLQ